MPRRTASLLCVALLSVNAALPAATPEQSKTLKLITEWVQGGYDNSAQARADERQQIPDELRHRLMHQIFIPVEAPDLEGHLVFQQSSIDGSLQRDRITRLGLLQFVPDDTTGMIRQRELNFRQPDDFKNAHLSPEKLAGLTLDDFTWDPGCDFQLTASSQGDRVSGPIGAGTCKFVSEGLGKTLTAEDEVVITPTQYWFLGRFIDENGTVMWGNASDEHVKMDRVASLETILAAGRGSVLIFGATRNTGLETARLLVGRGEQVFAMTRPTSDTAALEQLGVQILAGDALNREDVDRAFASAMPRAAITTIGCFRCDVPPDYIGNRNIFDAAAAAGVARIVLVSTVGAGNSSEAMPWPVSWFLGDVAELKTQAEDHLRNLPELDYTIIRPGGLKDGPPTGRGILTEDNTALGIIHRTDLAALITEILDDPDTIDRTYTAKDSELSWPWDMF